jgi:hypothetical protein
MTASTGDAARIRAGVDVSTYDIMKDAEMAAAGAHLGGAASPVSVRTLQRWRLEGGGPLFVKVGRLVRYPRSDLDAWMATRIYTSTSTLSERRS